MIKLHQKYFIESIPFEDKHPDQIRNSNQNFRNIHNIGNKLTRFQRYPETEFACKYNKPLYKTQYSKIIVEYTRYRKYTFTRTISLNSTYFGEIH